MVKNQTKKLESKENITYTTENTARNNRKDSTGKIGISVQNVEEIIKNKMSVGMRNTQGKAK